MAATLEGPNQTKGRAGKVPGAPKDKRSKGSKSIRVLAELARGSLHRFEAERVGDHCLPSTISGLSRRYGLRFEREWTRVPTRFGTDTEVKRYWLADESRELAARLVREGLAEGAP